MKKLSDRQIYERSITEEDVFSACRALLEFNGAKVHRVVERIPGGGRKSEPGIPDSFGWWPRKVTSVPGVKFMISEFPTPVHFYIEFKRPRGKHRPAQVLWIEEARADGVIAFFADSVEAMCKGFSEFGIHLKGDPTIHERRKD